MAGILPYDLNDRLISVSLPVDLNANSSGPNRIPVLLSSALARIHRETKKCPATSALLRVAPLGEAGQIGVLTVRHRRE